MNGITCNRKQYKDNGIAKGRSWSYGRKKQPDNSNDIPLSRKKVETLTPIWFNLWEEERRMLLSLLEEQKQKCQIDEQLKNYASTLKSQIIAAISLAEKTETDKQIKEYASTLKSQIIDVIFLAENTEIDKQNKNYASTLKSQIIAAISLAENTETDKQIKEYVSTLKSQIVAVILLVEKTKTENEFKSTLSLLAMDGEEYIASNARDIIKDMNDIEWIRNNPLKPCRIK